MCRSLAGKIVFPSFRLSRRLVGLFSNGSWDADSRHSDLHFGTLDMKIQDDRISAISLSLQ